MNKCVMLFQQYILIDWNTKYRDPSVASKHLILSFDRDNNLHGPEHILRDEH